MGLCLRPAKFSAQHLALSQPSKGLGVFFLLFSSKGLLLILLRLQDLEGLRLLPRCLFTQVSAPAVPPSPPPRLLPQAFPVTLRTALTTRQNCPNSTHSGKPGVLLPERCDPPTAVTPTLPTAWSPSL